MLAPPPPRMEAVACGLIALWLFGCVVALRPRGAVPSAEAAANVQ